MFSQFILSLVILWVSYKPTNLTIVDLSQILPKPTTCYLLNTKYSCTHLSTTLAPPLVHLSEKVYLDGRIEKYEEEGWTVTSKGDYFALKVKGDKEEYPIIIETPGRKHWIKIKPGHPWVSIEAIEGDLEFLREVVRKAMGGDGGHKPPGGPGEGNGDSPTWFDPPFKKGDLVFWLMDLTKGKMMVVDVFLKVLPETKKVLWMVEAVYKIQTGSGYQEVRDFAVNFKKATQ